jgi:hypothetical protein
MCPYFDASESNMQTNFLGGALIAATAFLMPHALAQTEAAKAAPSATVRADPMDAKAATVPLNYQSSLRDYRPNTAPALAPWRAANDKVGRIGGWRAYAKQASADRVIGSQE